MPLVRGKDMLLVHGMMNLERLACSLGGWRRSM